MRAPRYALVRPQDDVGVSAAEIGFPLALKPRHAHLFARHFGRLKAFVVRDKAELVAAHERLRALHLDVLAMEIVPGPMTRITSTTPTSILGGNPCSI